MDASLRLMCSSAALLAALHGPSKTLQGVTINLQEGVRENMLHAWEIFHAPLMDLAMQLHERDRDGKKDN